LCLVPLLHHLLAKSLRTADDETQRRARLLVIVTLVLLFANNVFLVTFLIIGRMATVPSVVAITVGLVCALVVVRRSGNLLLATNIVCGTFVIGLFPASFRAGGLFSPSLWMFNIIAAMLGFLLGNRRTGLAWTSVHLGSLALHVALYIAGVRLRMPPSNASAVMVVAGIVLSTVVLIGIALSYELTRERAFASIRDKTKHARLILDTIGDGYVLAAIDGTLTNERSRSVEAVFGVPSPGTRVWDYLEGSSEERALFHDAWLELVDGVVSADIALEQLPTRRQRAGRTYSIAYHLVLKEHDEIENVVLVVSDVTAQIVANEAQEARLEQAEIFQRVIKDPSEFTAFLKDAREIVAYLGSSSGPGFARALHTLKGNAALLGAKRLAAACHAMEDDFRDGIEPSAVALAKLSASLEAVAALFEPFVRDRPLGFTVSAEDIAAIDDLTAGSDAHEKIHAMIARWRGSSVERGLSRLAEKARYLAQRLDKNNVEIRVEASGLDVPEGALDSLWAPMAHLVRNALDHGVEPDDRRLAEGKRPAATIILSATVSEGEIVVAVSDDGGGVDWDAVRIKAAAQGLPADSQADLERALLADGFSTRSEATMSSGRGVGMGAVLEAAARLNGRVFVRSERGVGATIGVRLPRPGALHCAAA
jgi:HPt (histidine-containing phosphotransfer) domain-containing protein